MKAAVKEDRAKELGKLSQDLSKPIFKFFMRRINNEVLTDDYFGQMGLNEFVIVMLNTMALVDTNLLRWLENFHKLKTKKHLEFDKLHHGFTSALSKYLKEISK